VTNSGAFSLGIFFGFDEFTLTTNGMYGWTFSLERPATATSLSWYDQDLNGLSHEHQVGVWQGRVHDPTAPLFRVPDDYIVVTAGVELGPMLFIVPDSESISAPPLWITRTSDQAVLSWPLRATNFVLETSSDLAPGTSWIALTNNIGIATSSFVHTNLIGPAVAFYRLQKR
jgi:hypothetical protein